MVLCANSQLGLVEICSGAIKIGRIGVAPESIKRELLLY